ncbi:MAG: hypothetical protein LBL16_04285 [Endomicrobium sp.]|nr:hypothetical protein [Endomicrobium sp.]
MSAITIPEALYPAIFENIKKTQDLEYAQNNTQAERMQKELQGIGEKLDNLLELLLDKSITKQQYDLKYADLTRRKQDLTANLRKSDIEGVVYRPYRIHFKRRYSLKIGKNIPSLFKSSKVEEKRQIINLVLSNLKLKNKNLEFSYRKPVDLIKDFKDCAVMGG